ncbi:hypothetical protein V0M98_32825 (plasmid) [Pseudomonas silesiensis]|uniref:hypothetical protein n=1 Tax=Pseudomonas silesiensis TaxID=1853130 RepID=UPI0030CD1045
MNLAALIDLTNRRKVEDPQARAERLAASRVRMRQYAVEIENRIASEAVSHQLLAKVCTI